MGEALNPGPFAISVNPTGLAGKGLEFDSLPRGMQFPKVILHLKDSPAFVKNFIRESQHLIAASRSDRELVFSLAAHVDP